MDGVTKTMRLKELPDGSVLRLVGYPIGSSRDYRLVLSRGNESFQYPTTEDLPKTVLEDLYRSVDSIKDFGKILKNSGHPCADRLN